MLIWSWIWSWLLLYSWSLYFYSCCRYKRTQTMSYYRWESTTQTITTSGICGTSCNEMWVVGLHLAFPVTINKRLTFQNKWLTKIILCSWQSKCCGVYNYTDWAQFYNNNSVPDSCCINYTSSSYTMGCGSGLATKTVDDAAKVIYIEVDQIHFNFKHFITVLVIE